MFFLVNITKLKLKLKLKLCKFLMTKKHIIFYSIIIPNKNPLPKKGNGFCIIAKCSDHTLISTSTPEGSSNFIKASTVLEEEE